MMKQIFILIVLCHLLACENKKQNTNQEINKGIGEIQIKKQPYQKKEFVYSIKNIKDKHKNSIRKRFFKNIGLRISVNDLFL